MSTKKVTYVLDPFQLPGNWKSEVARRLNVHRNTVSHNVRAGKGEMYEKIKKTAENIYGKPIKTESL